MKREIKFRAWDKSRNEMYTPHTLHINPETKAYISIRYNGDYGEDSLIMQYTGLKDKNGVEIYEGDIVKSIDVNMLVAFNTVTASWDVFHCPGLEGDNLPIVDENGDYDYEVIGNIHENPELLS